MNKWLASLLAALMLLTAFGALAEIEAAPVELGPVETEVELWTDDMADAGQAVMAPQAADEALVPKAASAKNLVDYVDTKILGSGKVQATVHLNTAYAGMGREKWYVYALAGENDPVVESFDDVGISTPTTYVMKAKFEQGAGVLFGAYTDVTARNSWKDTSDYLEMLENGVLEEMPANPTDPKETAKTVTFKGTKLTKKESGITFENSRYYYVKLVLKKDAKLKLTKLVGSGGNPVEGDNANMIYVVAFSTDEDREPDYNISQVQLNKETFLAKGTYWLRFAFYYYNSNYPMAMDYAYSLLPYVNATGVKWTCKEVDDFTKPIAANKLLHLTAKIQPSSADAHFHADVEANNTCKDVVVSKDGKTLTCTVKNAPAEGGLITVTAKVVDDHSYATTKHSLHFGAAMTTPVVNKTTLTVGSKSAQYTSNSPIFEDESYLRVSVKSGKKWKVLTESKLGTASAIDIPGLKPNTKYTLKFEYLLKADDFTLASKAKTVKIKTGVKAKPAIKSVRISDKKTYKSKVKGHWDQWGNWVAAHYTYTYDYTLNVTLKANVPSGALGLSYLGYKVAGTGKTFKIKVSKDVIYKDGVFRFYSDKTFGGFSPDSAKTSIK